MHADMIVVFLIEGPGLTRSPLAREHTPASTGPPG